MIILVEGQAKSEQTACQDIPQTKNNTLTHSPGGRRAAAAAARGRGGGGLTHEQVCASMCINMYVCMHAADTPTTHGHPDDSDTERRMRGQARRKREGRGVREGRQRRGRGVREDREGVREEGRGVREGCKRKGRGVREGREGVREEG